jgi:hypothetical protein
MKPTVHVLGIHLPGQKIALTSGPGDALETIDIPSPLERYFGCPIDSSYDHLIQDWKEFQRRFHVFVTKEISAVDDFFCDGPEPHDSFSS